MGGRSGQRPAADRQHRPLGRHRVSARNSGQIPSHGAPREGRGGQARTRARRGRCRPGSMRGHRDTAPGHHLAVARRCLPSERRLARPDGFQPARVARNVRRGVPKTGGRGDLASARMARPARFEPATLGLPLPRLDGDGHPLRPDLPPPSRDQPERRIYRPARGRSPVSDDIWLVGFMQYDRGCFDHETCRLEPIANFCTFIGSKSTTMWLFATIEVCSRLWAGSVLGRRSFGTASRLQDALLASGDSATLNTSFVERLNLTIRQGVLAPALAMPHPGRKPGRRRCRPAW